MQLRLQGSPLLIFIKFSSVNLVLKLNILMIFIFRNLHFHQLSLKTFLKYQLFLFFFTYVSSTSYGLSAVLPFSKECNFLNLFQKSSFDLYYSSLIPFNTFINDSM
ncbi:UNVERIFIED_CONTAM: hypothetical protein RMT77_018757 [Armadillidium vulgare]